MARRFARLGLAQALLVELGRDLHHRREPLEPLAGAALGEVVLPLGLGDLDAGALGERARRLGKRHTLDAHEEAERVA